MLCAGYFLEAIEFSLALLWPAARGIVVTRATLSLHAAIVCVLFQDAGCGHAG